MGLCKRCGEKREFLNKNGICVFCEHPRKYGTIIKNAHNKNTRGTTLSSKTGHIDENMYLRV